MAKFVARCFWKKAARFGNPVRHNCSVIAPPTVHECVTTSPQSAECVLLTAGEADSSLALVRTEGKSIIRCSYIIRFGSFHTLFLTLHHVPLNNIKQHNINNK